MISALFHDNSSRRNVFFFNLLVACIFTGIFFAGCAPSLTVSRGKGQAASFGPREGMASYYAKKFHGRKTASGERFNMRKFTAAHRTLPFGTRVRVTNLSNGKSVVVRVNDRGPFKRGRIIDVSYAAAKAIGMVRAGTARVRIEIVK
jgi:rare lipoprotein A